MAERKCTKCGEEKPESEFHSLAYQCRDCKAAYDRTYREKNKERINANKKRYYSTQEAKDRKSEYDRLYRAQNRDHIDARRAAWAEENIERQRQYALTSAHRRRTRTKEGVDTETLMAWVNDQPKQCYWCRKKCADLFELDHYIPLSSGGKHEIENIVISCRPCNRSKQRKMPYEYAKEHGRLF